MAAQDKQSETVLVVDDEATIRMLVCDVLGDFGYGPLKAEDGPSELKELRSDARIDILVTDVGLKPFAMDDLANRIRVIIEGLHLRG